jgi:hypothetical protein
MGVLCYNDRTVISKDDDDDDNNNNNNNNTENNDVRGKTKASPNVRRHLPFFYVLLTMHLEICV